MEEERRCDKCKFSYWTEESSFDHYRISELLICKKHSTIDYDEIVREWHSCEEFQPRENAGK